MSAVTQLLLIEEDPGGECLLDTQRVARMYLEIFAGLREDPRRFRLRRFSNDRQEGIVMGVLVLLKPNVCAWRVRSPQSATSTVASRGELETNERLRAEGFQLLKS